MSMDFKGLEDFYESLAKAIDATDPRQRELFLVRLALVLANEMNNPDQALAAIETSLMTGNRRTDSSGDINPD